MKWVYYIFRLFFSPSCRHSWVVLEKLVLLGRDNTEKGAIYVLRCSHCGSLEEKEVRV